MRHCVVDAAKAGPGKGEEKLDELAAALRRTTRI
jgi:DNA-binding FrmR family transcriptional regulator